MTPRCLDQVVDGPGDFRVAPCCSCGGRSIFAVSGARRAQSDPPIPAKRPRRWDEEAPAGKAEELDDRRHDPGR